MIYNKNENNVTRNDLEITIEKIVNNTCVIDLHTHLFPPQHGNLMLWGIDELLHIIIWYANILL